MKSLSGVPDKGLVLRHPPLADGALAGQRIAVVGGTGGLGRAIARLLADSGADVTVVGRTFRDEGVRGLRFLRADLPLMREARRVGRELPVEDLDLIVLTTGIIAAPKREATAEGLERDLAVSYLSRLALVREIAPRLGARRPAAAPRPRLFVMGFPGTDKAGVADDLNSEKSYAPTVAHVNTIAGNEALVLDAARRYPGLDCFGLNPGLIKSNIRSNLLGGEGSMRHRMVESLIGLLMISAEQYAARITPLLFSPQLERRSGTMLNQQGVAILPSAVLTEQQVAALIAASEALLRRAERP